MRNLRSWTEKFYRKYFGILIAFVGLLLTIEGHFKIVSHLTEDFHRLIESIGVAILSSGIFAAI